MFHLDQSILKQRIRDLHEECQSYQAEARWLRTLLKKWIKKFKSHRQPLGTVEQPIINE